MSAKVTQVVIVGGGLAGVETAFSLRRLGWEDDLVVVDVEAELPYERPPLSKAILLGKTDAHRIRLRPPELYEQLGVTRLAGRRATSLDLAKQSVKLSDGTALDYHALVLATGAAPRRLQVPGNTLPGVLMLRTLSDSLALRSSLTLGVRLTVVGGGYLGLEVAAAAAQMGARVTLIEAGNRLLQRSGSRVLGDILANCLEREGVSIALDETVACFRGETCVEAVETTSGRLFQTDLALVAIGAAPNGELVHEAGLSGPAGILVDAEARTSLPNVYAVGDCANFHDPRFGRHARLESVQSATWQARIAAAGITGTGAPKPKHAYFWSELFDMKIQIAGYADPSTPSHEELVGNQAEGLAIYRFQHGRLAAVECINRPINFVQAQLLIGRVARNLVDLKEVKVES
ncbi:FAD-dependent oxidoreductase [Aminobacter aminovorans]|uniref:NAD(P)/FAD-dependent oxidoreductase n=1 Tax=Aminobacter aminovorans TaxID=83263 RepID=UPI00285FAF00|nr:FAD-dependent oxidoreductase [Aminobacter aminovorans]MDR7225179.1 3-phenylpropionate/trans-cinnamate dioxygenase ferredoxin reductase subunit [Aminobacter aminovorans]